MLENFSPFIISGKINKISGYIIEAVGLHAKIGSLWEIVCVGQKNISAQVIGFNSDITYLMTSSDLTGISPHSKIVAAGKYATVPLGEGLLGRVFNSEGEPLDNLGNLKNVRFEELKFDTINPLKRERITKPLDVGVKCINGLLTIGKGQRIGLFAGSGVGKSVLLGMITKYSQADVVVVSLVGERGREVKDFIYDNIGENALNRSVIVASPADTSPLARVKAAESATFIAEYFRQKNKHVLLLMDSITRYAHALRELGLSLGEPPTAKGYPPSVFTRIPKLVERAGNGVDEKSSITAIYTVLVEGDDMNDPIADCARGILDGHIVLSRELADMGHYPAIDIEESISRVMDKVIKPQHKKAATIFKRLYVKYRKNIDYISLGAYQKGLDPELDIAIENKSKLYDFLQQVYDQNYSFDSVEKLLDEFLMLDPART